MATEERGRNRTLGSHAFILSYKNASRSTVQKKLSDPRSNFSNV